MTTKVALKRILSKVGRLRQPSIKRKIALIYHSLGESQWAVSERMFRAQMEWLRASVKLVSLCELLEEDLDDALQVAITFDDGYASLHDSAASVLYDVKTTATVFLTTGCIDEISRNFTNASKGHYPQERFLSWRDVDELVAAGWMVGSHGMDHIDLTEATPEVARNQLGASKRLIEQRLSRLCEYFAYTWGHHNINLEDLVRNAGYRYAFSGHHAPILPGSNHLAVPRINVSNEYTMADFQSIIRGDWDYLGWIQKMKPWSRM